MYFPYLYGRQMELLALRDLATDLAGWANIVPVIEPVMAKPGDLGRCLSELQEARSPLYLIVNPSQGQLRDGVPDAWRERVGEFIANASLLYPAHQVTTEEDASAVQAFYQRFSNRRVAVVLRQPRISPQDLAEQLADRDAIVFVHTSANPRAYLQGLPAGKCVEVAASFNALARNADYSGSEWFSSSHLEFANDGRPGFSDFGPLPTTFRLQGGQAGAAAIHLTYRNDDGSLWIQHFVSDTTDRDQGDATSKIAEAVVKLAAEVDTNAEKFVESAGLQTLLANQVLELGGNKRQQIVHHLATVAVCLGETESPPTDLD
jgi:hypothetical protein